MTKAHVNLPKSVERIVLLDPAAGTPTIAKKAKKRRKGARALAPFSKMLRAFTQAQLASAEDLAKRHQRADKKRKDGGLKAWRANIEHAYVKGMKLFRKKMPY